MEKRYIIFNKPYGVLSQFTSEPHQRNLSEFALPKGVYAAGRLDRDSEGLLLLTNDGPFIKTFLDNHPRTYWSQVEGIPSNEELALLEKGIKLKDGLTKKCQASLLKDEEFKRILPRNPPIRVRKRIPTSWIELVLWEGKNRQVRRMTAALGFPTLRLIRVGLGALLPTTFKLPPSGSWADISKSQIHS